MKVKTSITLQESVLKDIDRRVGRSGNRSLFVEKAVQSYLGQLSRNEMNRRDLELINAHAGELNAEAAEVLSYQIPL